MATTNGYGVVSEQGFVGFEAKLSEGAWRTVDVKPWVTKTGELHGAITEVPALVLAKVRMVSAIGDLARALAGQSLAGERDAAWDRMQERLAAEIALKATDDDPSVVAAAVRARAALLLGEGTGQTNLTHRAEVEHGRTQVRLAATAPLSADIARLKLGPTLDRVKETTDALEAALRDTDGDRTTPRSRQIRAAWSACVVAFNSAHDQLDALFELTPSGPARDQVAALRVPFEHLLADHRERVVKAVTAVENGTPGKPTG